MSERYQKRLNLPGRAVLKSTAEGKVSMRIEAPQIGEGTKFRPTNLMEKSADSGICTGSAF
jgi:hypothetical protein